MLEPDSETRLGAALMEQRGRKRASLAGAAEESCFPPSPAGAAAAAGAAAPPASAGDAAPSPTSGKRGGPCSRRVRLLFKYKTPVFVFWLCV